MYLNYLLNNAVSCDLAIDPGTDMTAVYVRGKGVVLKEPSYIAYDTATKKIQAVGEEAYEMLGKAPPSVKVVKPIEAGVVADYEMSCKLFKYFIDNACTKKLLKPRIIASVAADSTEIEKKGLANALLEAGVREVFLIEEPLAAACGAGCDISLARGMLIADIGAGVCDVASISLGRAVISKSVKMGGNAFTENVMHYIKKNYNLNIGYLTAEKIKKEIGCAYPFELSKTLEVTGCGVSNGLPGKIIINSEELRDSFTGLLKKIAETIKTTLEETPPELQSDILEDGILITGGGEMLYGLEKWLTSELGIKVFTTDKMDECVINGAGEQLAMLDTSGEQPDKYYYTI